MRIRTPDGRLFVMATMRTYDDGCAAAHALDLVGERWALLVVRELLLGPKRFTDLRTGIPKASPNVLAQRLRELESAGVVAKRRLPPPAASQVYELTPWGHELEPVMTALGRWGARSPLRSDDEGMSPDAHVLALRTMYDPAKADGLEGEFALVLDEDRYALRVDAAGLQAEHGEPAAPLATISGSGRALLAVAFEGVPFADA